MVSECSLQLNPLFMWKLCLSLFSVCWVRYENKVAIPARRCWLGRLWLNLFMSKINKDSICLHKSWRHIQRYQTWRKTMAERMNKIFQAAALWFLKSAIGAKQLARTPSYKWWRSRDLPIWLDIFLCRCEYSRGKTVRLQQQLDYNTVMGCYMFLQVKDIGEQHKNSCGN